MAETMTEREYIEAQKTALKKNIKVWIFVLIYLLVAGLVLCLILYGILMLIMFVVNLINVLKTKKMLKRIENGEVGVKEIYEFYISMAQRNTTLFVVNIFCGGLFGVIGTIFDMRVSTIGRIDGEKILGEDYKNERIANDSMARWHYCIYCKRNLIEAAHLYRITDGVICENCLSPYSSMLEKRVEDPALLNSKSTANYMRPENAITNLSSKDLEERLEYLKKNMEYYSYFTPTKVICDGCLEIDERNLLFRIVRSNEYDSVKVGVPSGLIHSYSEIKGIAYEMIYEYDIPSDETNGGWRYTTDNSIVFAIDNPYFREETFTLKHITTGFFESSKAPQIAYAEQTVKELQAIFNMPIMESRKVRRKLI